MPDNVGRNCNRSGVAAANRPGSSYYTRKIYLFALLVQTNKKRRIK